MNNNQIVWVVTYYHDVVVEYSPHRRTLYTLESIPKEVADYIMAANCHEATWNSTLHRWEIKHTVC